jgi:hypothetical protein
MNKSIAAIFISLSLLSCRENKPITDKAKERVENICDQFMGLFATNKFPEAFLLLKKNSPMSSSSIDTLQLKTAEYANNTFPGYGKIRSFEFIRERTIKDFIAIRYYIIKFDHFYLKFAFTLYNNGREWTITEFTYNEELSEVLN